MRPCKAGEFWDTTRERCEDLLQRDRQCADSLREGGRRLLVDITNSACVQTCDWDKEKRTATKTKECPPKPKRPGIASSLGGIFGGMVNLVMVAGSALGSLFGSTTHYKASPPEMCYEVLGFCVPLCGDGTFLYAVRQPAHMTSSGVASKEQLSLACVKECPDGLVGNTQTLKCEAMCPKGMWRRYDIFIRWIPMYRNVWNRCGSSDASSKGFVYVTMYWDFTTYPCILLRTPRSRVRWAGCTALTRGMWPSARTGECGLWVQEGTKALRQQL